VKDSPRVPTEEEMLELPTRELVELGLEHLADLAGELAGVVIKDYGSRGHKLANQLTNIMLLITYAGGELGQIHEFDPVPKQKRKRK
jgi:hypothetical protein